MTVTRTGALRKARAACKPPKPAPTITTRGITRGRLLEATSTLFGALRVLVVFVMFACTSVIWYPHIGLCLILILLIAYSKKAWVTSFSNWFFSHGSRANGNDRTRRGGSGVDVGRGRLRRPGGGSAS